MKNKALALTILTLASSVSKPMTESGIKTVAQGLFNQGYEIIQKNPKLTATFATLALGTTWYATNGYERRDSWKGRRLNLALLPKNFDFGAANSDIQWSGLQYDDEGSQADNNWLQWLKEKPEDMQIGTASDHWTKYKDDFKLAKDFVLDRLRISLEWSKYQQNGPYEYNEDVINHYVNEIVELKRQGLKVTLCFYHHALPNWFVGSGGFEKKENIKFFTDAALYIFNRVKYELKKKEFPFDPENDLILTFNEPAGYALAAYVYGKYPPGKKMDLETCGIVTKNMLDAHCQLRNALKKIDPKLQVSIAHMMRPIKPYNPWNPIDILPAKIFNYLLNNVTLEYLSTGKFTWLNFKKILGLKIPWFTTQVSKEAQDSLDYFGLNYYSVTFLDKFKPNNRPSDVTSHAEEGELGNAIYAEGFADCIELAHKYFPNKPIYITELGFPARDTKEDIIKYKKFMKRHFWVIIEAIKKGINIIGVDIWTLLNCYGWNGNNGSEYGLYSVDLNDQNKPRRLKGNSIFLKTLIQEYRKKQTA